MNVGLYPIISKPLVEAAALFTCHGKHMPDMSKITHFYITIWIIRQLNHGVLNLGTITSGNSGANSIVIIKMRKFDTYPCRLNLVKPRIGSLVYVMILIVTAIIPDCSNLCCELIVISCHCTAVAKTSKVLAWIKRKSTCITKVPASTPFKHCAVCLGRVFYNLEIIFLCK